MTHSKIRPITRRIKFISTKYTPEQELEAVAKSVKGFVDSFADSPIEEQPTIAILVPRNQRGVEMVNALRQRGMEPIELISSTSETRAAGALSYLLSYLSEPGLRGSWGKRMRCGEGLEREGVGIGKWMTGDCFVPYRDDIAKFAPRNDIKSFRRMVNVGKLYRTPHLTPPLRERGWEKDWQQA
ncbi:MAG: hypothetical protein IPP55_02720 [Anaerolineales bacterium]|nr:hypothetical protein [Anaerolineales bacterium]